MGAPGPPVPYHPLSWQDWLLAAGLGLFLFPVVELTKWIISEEAGTGGKRPWRNKEVQKRLKNISMR